MGSQARRIARWQDHFGLGKRDVNSLEYQVGLLEPAEFIDSIGDKFGDLLWELEEGNISPEAFMEQGARLLADGAAALTKIYKYAKGYR